MEMGTVTPQHKKELVRLFPSAKRCREVRQSQAERLFQAVKDIQAAKRCQEAMQPQAAMVLAVTDIQAVRGIQVATATTDCCVYLHGA